MINLKKILSEVLEEKTDLDYAKPGHHLFPKGAGETLMMGIVISHKNGITPDEGADIVKTFEKSDKDADLKYYPATKKVVGKVSRFRFFAPNYQYFASGTSYPRIEKARVKYDLDKIKKGLEITKKTTIK